MSDASKEQQDEPRKNNDEARDTESLLPFANQQNQKATQEMDFAVQRRQMFDQLVWQIPTLLLTGESFLFLISLGAGVSNTARIISSLLGIVVGMSSIHSFARLTTMEWYDAHTLRLRIENNADATQFPVLGEGYRRARARYYADLCCDWWKECDCRDGVVAWTFMQCSHTRVWSVCFIFIIAANLVIFILSCIQEASSDDRYFK
jgi:hypothetical protein